MVTVLRQVMDETAEIAAPGEIWNHDRAIRTAARSCRYVDTSSAGSIPWHWWRSRAICLRLDPSRSTCATRSDLLGRVRHQAAKHFGFTAAGIAGDLLEPSEFGLAPAGAAHDLPLAIFRAGLSGHGGVCDRAKRQSRTQASGGSRRGSRWPALLGLSLFRLNFKGCGNPQGGANAIHALDGSRCADGRPMGEDGAALPGQAHGP